MKKVLIRTLGLLLVCAVAALPSSCVKDGWNTCNNRIRIVYDYNIDRVDKFHVQVTFLSVFVFDSATGLFVQELKFTGNPFNRDFEFDVPESLYGGTYDYLVWAGLNPDDYAFVQMQKGVSKIEDLEVQVKGYDQQLIDRDLEPLWHGLIREKKFEAASERTEVISLMKDTKTFRLVFDFLENGVAVNPYDADDLDISIYAPDGWMAYDNTVLDPTDRLIKYSPYIGVKDVSGALVYELNTLRLMEDRNMSLVISDKAAGKEVFRMPLVTYLNLLRLAEESWVKEQQEYLDREDSFKIVILIDKSGPGAWIAVEMLINDWVVREHGVEGV